MTPPRECSNRRAGPRVRSMSLMATYARPSIVTTYECRSWLLSSSASTEFPTNTRPFTFPFTLCGFPANQERFPGCSSRWEVKGLTSEPRTVALFPALNPLPQTFHNSSRWWESRGRRLLLSAKNNPTVGYPCSAAPGENC